MISYIKGEIADVSEDRIVIENNGIGYNIFVPKSIIQTLPSLGSEMKIYTYPYIREDAMNLYGFLTKDDLNIFKLLIGVSGIGPKGALGILSVITPDELRFAVLSDDVNAIKKAPGIGGKTAQKLIIELKDKLNIEDILNGGEQESSGVNETDDIKGQAVQALVALGYSQSSAFKAVNKVGAESMTDVEDVLKAALKNII